MMQGSCHKSPQAKTQNTHSSILLRSPLYMNVTNVHPSLYVWGSEISI